jgi:hypothetical protein
MAATTAAIISGGIQAGAAAKSFYDMAQEQQKVEAARINAKKIMDQTRALLKQNVYEGLSIVKEPYERAMEAMNVTGAGLTQAGVESDRGAAAVAGRVQMGMNEGARDIAEAQSKEQQAINQAIATEESRLRDMTAGVNLDEIEGAQKAGAQAEARANADLAQGMGSLAALGGTIGNALPLYYQSKGAKMYGDLSAQATAAGMSQQELQGRVAALSSNPEFAELSGLSYTEKPTDENNNPIVGAATPAQFQDYLSQRPDLIKKIIESNIFATQGAGGVSGFSGVGGGGYDMINSIDAANNEVEKRRLRTTA